MQTARQSPKISGRRANMSFVTFANLTTELNKSVILHIFKTCHSWFIIKCGDAPDRPNSSSGSGLPSNHEEAGLFFRDVCVACAKRDRKSGLRFCTPEREAWLQSSLRAFTSQQPIHISLSLSFLAWLYPERIGKMSHWRIGKVQESLGALGYCVVWNEEFIIDP